MGLLKELLQHGGYVRDSDSTGMIPLHSAASYEGPGENSDAIRLLLAAGADFEAKKTVEFDFSPLVIAAYCEFASCGPIRALLEGAADINAVDTPSRCRCMACSSVYVVGFLLQWGAD